MLNFKTSLLLATIVAGAVASPAFAQTALPLAAPATGDAALHGAGASSIQNVLVRDMNCIGVNKQLGGSGSSSSLSTIAAGNYAGSPALDCSLEANNLQPNLAGEYVSTGSGFGRQMWKNFSDDFDGSTSTTKSTGVFNPFGNTVRWPNLQFAMSDAGLLPAELTTYNSKAAPAAGPAISFPLFVLPVAIAFDTTYGVNASSRAMVFNTQGKGLNNATTLNLTKSVYCGIFNGDIKNWNDSAIQKLNGRNMVKGVNLGVPLFDVNNDTAARWAADGAPIRLVGRLDKSGTTDVFTRHLAAACTAANGYTGTNKYARNAETLPFVAVNSAHDFRSVRSDTNYNPTVTDRTKYAGDTNLVSGDYFKDNTTGIVNIGAGTPTSLPTGNVGSGLFLIANGGGAVARAIVYPSDYTLGTVKLNGKVGYISADFVQPSVDAPGGLNAAALQIGKGTTYAVPSVANALKAFTQPAPESDALGNYQPGTDTRQVPLLAGGKGNATRANPLAWAEVPYADSANTLADPAAGYAITGTTQFFGYTCYAGANREAMVNLLGTILGQVKKNSAGAAVSPNTFGGTQAAAPGINVQSNIGGLPAPWVKAVTQTFLLKGDAQAAGLYIQDLLMPVYSTTATLVPAVAPVKDSKGKIIVPGVPAVKGLGIKTPTAANPICDGKAGA